jgi:hypothetical protein
MDLQWKFQSSLPKFLRSLRAQVKSPSISALLEGILADVRGGDEMEQLNAKVSAYYDSLSDAQVREDAARGQAGESALAGTEIESDQPRLAQGER